MSERGIVIAARARLSACDSPYMSACAACLGLRGACCAGMNGPPLAAKRSMFAPAVLLLPPWLGVTAWRLDHAAQP